MGHRDGAVSSNEVCPEIEMTVPWGRRERWGVESGRVADFVGLLKSAELDASGYWKHRNRRQTRRTHAPSPGSRRSRIRHSRAVHGNMV